MKFKKRQLSSVIELLKNNHLLSAIHVNEDDVDFFNVTYDSRKVVKDTLFILKGNYKDQYIDDAIQKGAVAIISENSIENHSINNVVVDDIQKAMAVVAKFVFDFPDEQLRLIGITGTKGKSSTAYFAYQLLDELTNHHAGLISTIETKLGQDDQFKSKLTTPESLDLFSYFRDAVDNGITHLVMEVSSQAYLKQRVFGVEYNVGIFLNISPDHIGPLEHPTFEDYLAHKLMLFEHAKYAVINQQSDEFEKISSSAKKSIKNDHIIFVSNQQTGQVNYKINEQTLLGSKFSFASQEKTLKELNGQYSIPIPGDFNVVNSIMALTAVKLLFDDVPDIKTINQIISTTFIPGRMVVKKTSNDAFVVVDYAHNYSSVDRLFSFLLQQGVEDKKNIIVLGSPGDKAQSRRKDFSKVINKWANIAILTTDDSGFESPLTIAKEIDEEIDHQKVDVHIEIDRLKAIQQAIELAQDGDLVVIAGKGDDQFQKTNGKDEPYIGDVKAVSEIIDS